MAPAGTCTWTSCLANQSSGMSAWPRTCDSAASADSRITSPSWPVIVSLPLPGIALASTNSTSPPTGVRASPVATPGSAVRRRIGLEARAAEQLAHARRGDRHLALERAQRHLERDLAARRADLALEAALAPASRVYEPMIALSPASLNATCEA